MRSALKYVTAALLVLFVAHASADDGKRAAVPGGGLIAAAVPDALPLAARDASGGLVGFDIEVAKEIAKRLGRPLAFATPGWNAILAGDWKGKWDFSVSNITPTEERSRRLDFPSVYRFEAVIVVVRKDDKSVSMPADVSRKRVGVAQGTTFEHYLRRDLTIYAGDDVPDYLIAEPAIRLFASKGEALNALARGDGAALDAVVTSYSTAQTAIDKGLALRIVPGFLFWEPVAVAVEKGNGALARRIVEAIEAMTADGTLGALSTKWFGLDMTTPIAP
ncbi:MAG: transporter substrate-binding domain-containing protein [Alphaproteobacteria bacterium]|nr:transporter substrate-binding domain-containing protein [Alphaproteobacteria bacterium]